MFDFNPREKLKAGNPTEISVKKQETLEEANWKVLGTKNDTFYNGAKWQADRMYSEDKVIILLNKFGGKVYGDYTRNQTMEDFTEEWFEQHKKK